MTESKNDINNLVDDEVHRKLFHWFEKRGLLLELRAHMRQQMVKALQENVTELNSCRKRSSSSPKFQAMHMLIADFLVQQEHHYTVSVFSTEVPILNNLPEFSAYVVDILQASKEGSLPLTNPAPRFSAVDIQDILETLGLPTHTQAGAYAAELYAESGEALLTCIVRALSGVHGVGTSQHNLPTASNQLSPNYVSVRQLTDSEDDVCKQNADQWTREMKEILLQSDVKIRHINKLQEKMKKFHENELLRVRQEEASKYETLCAQQEAELEMRLREEISREYAEQERGLEKQKEDLHSLALQLHAEHTEVTERLFLLQIQSDEVDCQKKQQEDESVEMEKLRNNIISQQRQIEESYTRLTIDQENLRREQYMLKSCQLKPNVDETNNEDFQRIIQQQYSALSKQLEEAKEKLADHDCVLVPRQACSTTSTQTETQNHIDREQQTLCSAQTDPELVHQLQLEREAVSQLQEENVELQAYVLQQRCRIDELTHRASTLAAQLEEAQRSIAEHECQERIIAVPSSPALPPRSHPPLVHPTQNYLWQPQQSGAGEESLFFQRHVPQQPSIRHEARRRPMRFNCNQNVSPTSEDSSPTDETLNEARRRLRDLEEQSATVNRSYREFQARQLEQSNTVVLNRNTPNSLGNGITNYFTPLPIPSQVPLRRTRVYNHPRLHTQIDISDDSDDECDLVSLRRSQMINRFRNVTNRCFVPIDNPSLSRRMYFTNFKHFSKYANFKRKCGKLASRKPENDSNLSIQSELPEKKLSRTENQACQTSFKYRIDNKESSSDSDSFFERSDSVKYKKSKSTPKHTQSQSYQKVKVSNRERDNLESCVKNTEDKLEQPKILDIKIIDHKETSEPAPPKIMNPLSSAISSGSLAVDSIPKDDSMNDIRQGANEELLNKNIANKSNNISDIENKPVIVYENNTSVEPLPLTVPNLSLLHENTTGETQIPHELPPVALSVTSGSDIFRELDVSQSDQSEDPISAPHEDFSKHSSDFWE